MFMTHMNLKWMYACLHFRHFTNKLPNGFRNSFSKQAECHKYLTRNANDYTLTRNKKVFSDQIVRTSGPILWNSLHHNFKMSKTVKYFRNQLKNYLISQYFKKLFWFGAKKHISFASFCCVHVFFPFNLFFCSFYLSVS